MYNSTDEQNILRHDKLHNATLKKLNTKSKHLIWDIIELTDCIFTRKDDIFERWVKFYEELYFSNSQPKTIDDSAFQDLFLTSNIFHAINNLKSGKSLDKTTYTQN